VPGFPKPTNFDYTIQVEKERNALRERREFRQIPERQEGHLLLATWNVANLGAKEQPREPEWFELIAKVVTR
jgi:hypothetical protein